MSTTATKDPNSVAEAEELMRAADARYRAAFKVGDEEGVRRERLEYHRVKNLVPGLRQQEAQERFAGAAALGAERRPAVEAWAKQVAEVLGQLHELVVEGRPLFDGEALIRRAPPDQMDAVEHSFRRGLGWLDGLKPLQTRDYASWLIGAHEAGVELPASFREDPALANLLRRHGITATKRGRRKLA